MKLNKLYAFVLAATMVGCTEEDTPSWNSQKATVSMGQAELVCKENKGVINVPVTVEGKRNGIIEVEVEVAEYGDNPAFDDVHYILTSNKVIIPADATEGQFEFRAIDDNEINESRTFTITIKSAKHAEVNTEANSTMVILKDNDSQLYERLQGSWKMVSKSKDLGSQNWKVNIIGAEEGAEGYNEVLQATFTVSDYPVSMTLNFSYDQATKKGHVYIPFGSILAANADFGFDKPLDVVAVTFDSKDNFVVEGGIYGYWNEDCTEIIFDKDQTLYGWLFYGGDPTLEYYLFDCSNIKLTK